MSHCFFRVCMNIIYYTYCALFADQDKPLRAGNIVISMFVGVVAAVGIVAGLIYGVKKRKQRQSANEEIVEMPEA